MTDKERIQQLEEALRPFAEYGAYMKDRWTQRDSNAFYGVKRRDAPQIKIGDFRHALRVLCIDSDATIRASLEERSRAKSNVQARPTSTLPSATQPNEWSSTNMMASKLSDLSTLLSVSDNANENPGTPPLDPGPNHSDGNQAGKLSESVLEIAREQRLQIAILAAEFGHRSCEQGHSMEHTLAKVMEVLGDEGSDSDSRR